MTPKPVFILFTRSFWLSAIGVAILFAGAGPLVFDSVGFLVGSLTTLDPLMVSQWLTKVAPLVLWAGALWERRGQNRPYSINPKDT